LSTPVNASKRRGRHWRRVALACALAAVLAVAWHETHKPLAKGVHVASAVCAAPADAVAFIPDITAADAWGHPALSQGIFDAVLQVVRGARRFVVLDYASFGSAAEAAVPQRRIATELTDVLLERRRKQPDLAILFITDPATERYGTVPSPDLQLLRAAGIAVVSADLDPLRDPNLVWSGLWRLGLRWWDRPSGPFGVATRRLNFKASDRRLVIADDGHGGLAAVVGSASPTDSESSWSNAAARVSGAALESLLASELEIARLSGWRDPGTITVLNGTAAGPPAQCTASTAGTPPTDDTARVQVLTEGAIRQALLDRLAATEHGDSIDAALFHLADRGVVEALLAAARRGVRVRLILDPNETADRNGGTSGLPNQPVASELVSRSGGAIRVRWYRTHGERFHSAVVIVSGTQGAWLTVGSAQLTRRSLEDFNLEANVAIEAARGAPLPQQVLGYFETLWSNRAALGIEYTGDFAAFANPAQSDYWLYRLLEGAGASAF
jgi:phosphatidylserine/phosphatidylglycerophosphate/cardiolipin synthase-like enzyme